MCPKRVRYLILSFESTISLVVKLFLRAKTAEIKDKEANKFSVIISLTKKAKIRNAVIKVKQNAVLINGKFIFIYFHFYLMHEHMYS